MIDLMVSIGVNERSGTSNCFAQRCISRSADGAKPPAATARAGLVRVVPVRTPPIVSRDTTSFFSSSGAGSSSTNSRFTSRRFRRASKGSAIAMPLNSTALSVRCTLRSATSSSAPNALVPASSMVLRSVRSPKSSQNPATTVRPRQSGMIPRQRKMTGRFRCVVSLGDGPLPVAGGPYGVAPPLRTEPAVDIVGLRCGEDLVEVRLPHALTQGGGKANEGVARRKAEGNEQHEPHDEAAEDDRVVEVRERGEGFIAPRCPQRAY